MGGSMQKFYKGTILMKSKCINMIMGLNLKKEKLQF